LHPSPAASGARRALKRFLISASLVTAIGAAHGQVSPAERPPPTPRYSSLDGTTFGCPSLISDRPDLVQMREDVLRPDPNYRLQLPPGGFEGEQFKKFMADLNERRAKDWPDLCHYRAANAALLASGARPQMIFMGDSITENWVPAHPGFFRQGFVGRGISGQSSPQMLARFYADVVALRPRFVHIMTGTNDIGGATGPSLEQDYLNNVNAMIDIAQAHGITVILAGIPPITKILPKPDFDPLPMVRRMNADLKAIAQQRKLVFVDYYSRLADPTGGFDRRFSNEGVHPNRDGYTVMESLLSRAYAQARGKPPK